MFLTALFWIVYFISLTKVHLPNKVKKKAKIRNRYNQAPHLTQDTTWERNNNTIKHHIQERQEVSPCPEGNHKAAKVTKHYFRSLKNSGEILDKLKARDFNATSLSTYDFFYSLHYFTS